MPIPNQMLPILLTIWTFASLESRAESPPHSVFHPHPDVERTADGNWKMHDEDRPLPPKVEPKSEAELADSAKAPTGAVALFDGTDLSAWIVPHIWRAEMGRLEVRPQNMNVQTRAAFGSCRLHLEWRAPPGAQGDGQNRANSGVFLMNTYEIQVLDTCENKTYADGMGSAMYGMYPPDVNALRPTGEWQYYDIWFRRPQFDEKGAMVEPAAVTMMVNGHIVHNNRAFDGPSGHKKRPAYRAHPAALPLALQFHSQPVDFRNIWLVPLSDDAVLSPAGPVTGR